MTVEFVVVAGLEPSPALDQLLADITSAAGRARKASPGDRFDISRFESLCTQLETIVSQTELSHRRHLNIQLPANGRQLFGADTATWNGEIPPEVFAAAAEFEAEGLRPVVSTTPFGHGETVTSGPRKDPVAPAERWESVSKRRSKAVEERFRSQITAAIAGGSGAAISPSGISNRVVTQVLRESVHSDHESGPIRVPVEYRDGSRSANPMALRSLVLTDTLPPFDIELRFALLSIRHTEMDATVHGAWLRNSEISQHRRHAETDDLVYEISREQLDVLTQRGNRRLRLYLYQTGLQPAVMGFYKALTDHMVQHPSSVAVQPMFFAQQGASGGNAESAPFRKGLPWAQ